MARKPRSPQNGKRQEDWLEIERFTYGNVICSVRLERQANMQLEPVVGFWPVSRRVGFTLSEMKDVTDAVNRAHGYMRTVQDVFVKEKRPDTVNRIEPILKRVGR